MQAKMVPIDAKSVIPKEEFVKTLKKLSADKKITSNPDWPGIKKGLEDAIHGRVSAWKPPFK